jgi:hypothetical protein
VVSKSAAPNIIRAEQIIACILTTQSTSSYLVTI